jgi:hypothetical protein
MRGVVDRFFTFRHVLFRPGGDNAYASEPLPSLYKAVEARDEAALRYEAAAVGAAIAEVAALLQPSLLFESSEL